MLKNFYPMGAAWCVYLLRYQELAVKTTAAHLSALQINASGAWKIQVSAPMSKISRNAVETGQCFWTKTHSVHSLFGLVVLLFFASIPLIMAKPAFAIRRINVQHLFDITGNLNAASDVSVSKDGKIYVVDGVNHKIRVFNSNGKPIFSFGMWSLSIRSTFFSQSRHCPCF